MMRVIAIFSLAWLLLGGINAVAAENVLWVGISGDVETLDPNFSRYPIAKMANLNAYDQFFRYGFTGRRQSDLPRCNVLFLKKKLTYPNRKWVLTHHRAMPILPSHNRRYFWLFQ